ncbi:MAG: bifunctional (p)ppGpp synthetase/guanosine-3',5'-bis(diphosphate) 3'-pyrophosphohydrolase [Hydrogenothermaceae bacterium]
MKVIEDSVVKSLIDKVDYLKEEDIKEIESASLFIIDKHKNQYRKSGEPYYIHPIEVAKIIADLKLDKTSIISALLHDVVEDTDTTLDEIANIFGEKVAQIVDGVTKIGKYQFDSVEKAKIENFRKLIVSTAKDIRVIIVKLADRLHNLRTLQHLREEKQKRIAQESLEIYSPLAGRLGLWNIKREIDDLSFYYLYPEDYKKVETYFAHSKQAIENYLKENVIPVLRENLEKNGIKADIQYRAKHLYSIYEKTLRKNLKLSDIHDVIGVRVLVNDVKECYLALGVIHSIWTPIPGKFKDYISLPKSNLYQALHTTVIASNGKFVEIQIKTHQMHKIAEEGIAAHWRYKGGESLTEKDLQSFVWLRNLLETLKEDSSTDILKDISNELTSDEIYIFTPKGDLIKLPAGSTPVDFAYAIHTQVGHKTVGARVNGKLVPLDTKLQSGDKVEIITQENHNPSRDWLKFVVSSKAKTNIKQYIAKIEREQAIKFGEKLLEKFLKKINLKLSNLTSQDRENIINRFHYKSFEDFLVALGDGKISPLKVIRFLKGENSTNEGNQNTTKSKEIRDLTIEVDGHSNIMSYIANCCNPIPGDKIIGIITKGKGIAIHNRDCVNAKKVLETQPEKVVNIVWNKNSYKGLYLAKIKVISEDKPGVLASVSNVIASKNSNIKNVKVNTLKNGKANMVFYLQVRDTKHLNEVLNSIRPLKDVIKVQRVF